MSSALFESPVATSQLYFAWCENAQVETETLRPSVSATPRPTAKLSQTSSSAHQPPAPSKATIDESQHLSFTKDRRIAQPVRMGEVMIKLLKRYGITDEEIEEGMAAYARKHRPSLAS